MERVTQMVISPTYAKQLLSRNPMNRRSSPDRVQLLVNVLKAGQWKLNGETIIVAADGTLLDGQHRLQACVQAGVPFSTFIVFGVEKDTFDTIDSGKSRTGADNLHIKGYKNAILLAGALRLRALHESGNFSGTTAGLPGLTGAACTSQGLVEIAERSQDLIDAARDVVGKYRKAGKLITQSLAIFFLAEFSKQDKSLAEMFFEDIEKGEGLSASDPTFLLRERLIERASSKRKISREEVAAITVKTWVAYRDSNPLRQLRYSMTGERREQFPSWEYHKKASAA